MRIVCFKLGTLNFKLNQINFKLRITSFKLMLRIIEKIKMRKISLIILHYTGIVNRLLHKNNGYRQVLNQSWRHKPYLHFFAKIIYIKKEKTNYNEDEILRAKLLGLINIVFIIQHIEENRRIALRLWRIGTFNSTSSVFFFFSEYGPQNLIDFAVT